MTGLSERVAAAVEAASQASGLVGERRPPRVVTFTITVRDGLDVRWQAFTPAGSLAFGTVDAPEGGP